MRIRLSLCLVTFVLITACSGEGAEHSNVSSSSSESTIDDKTILDRKTRVLNLLSNLSSDTFNGVIAGQNAYHGDEITSGHPLDGYNSVVTSLHAATGKWVGLVGVDYEFSMLFRPEQLTDTNQVLIDHWNNGGLITINLAPHNPWKNDELDLIYNQGTWDGDGNSNDKELVTSLMDLIDPTKEVNAAWMRKLDRIAGALQELKEAGVIVLWRPLQEMNGSWFWWGMSSHPSDPTPYIELYRHMYDYFTVDKKLNNLLWVYSPNSSMGASNTSSWNRTVDWAYPGDDVVDIVAGTVYENDLVINDYEVYKSLGKPMGMGEYYSTIGEADQHGSLDTRLYVNRIKNDYPRVAYWVSHHSYPQAYWSLITNQNHYELMNNEDVITREDISY